MRPPAAVLDRDQRGDLWQHHGIYGHEVHRQEGLLRPWITS